MSNVYNIYVIRVDHDKREKLMEHLKKNGIDTGIHYPVPLHLQKAYKSLGYKTGDLEVSEKVAKEIISLPIYPLMKKHEAEKVVTNIKEFFNHKV